MKEFEIVKSWLIDNDKKTDKKIVKFKQINEFLKFCVYDIVRIAHKIISDLRENTMLSAVGYEIGNDNDEEEDFPSEKLVNV